MAGMSSKADRDPIFVRNVVVREYREVVVPELRQAWRSLESAKRTRMTSDMRLTGASRYMMLADSTRIIAEAQARVDRLTAQAECSRKLFAEHGLVVY